MKKCTLIFSVISLCFILIYASGCCSSSAAGVTPSTTPITADDTYTVVGPASGRAFAAIIYLLPIAEKKPAGLARDRAIASSSGNALIECTESFTVLSLYFVTFIWTTCEGTAVKVERKAEQTN
jgi:hypothetical protein